jgi:predicted signal transduction protein with EAL and GGDEF domain
MGRLAAFFAAVAVVVFGFAALSLWQLQAPRHAATRGELTRRADLALRAAAKRGPGAIVAFDVAIDTVSTDQKFIHRELPRAISANDLDLHYQPIVSSQGGRMVGVEALLRWNHATRGSIPPATFIPVAEQMGLMGTIGAFVLRRALHEAKRWPEDLYIAVNLSPLQVRDGTIVELVRSALAESSVSPGRLVLEITEGVLIDNPDEMVKRIKDLHELGVRVALDDFGSGYSISATCSGFARQDQDHQSFVAARRSSRRRDHPGDRGAWARAWADGGGRGRGDRAAARAAAARRLRRDAGLFVRQAGAGQGDRRCWRRPSRRPPSRRPSADSVTNSL